MKLSKPLIAATAALLACVGAAHLVLAQQARAHHAPRGTVAATQAASGRIMAIRRHASFTAVALHSRSETVIDLRLSHSSPVLTQDGHPLAVGALRVGDQLVREPNGKTVDASQRTVNLSGVVSEAPGPDGSLLIVQINQSQSVVADTRAETPYTDLTHQTASLANVDEADQIHLRGVLDGALHEVTQVDSITRTGPTRHPGSGH